MRLALYQPDIAPNAGTLMRLAACLGLGVDFIEPAGFLLADARFRRAAMDYLDRLDLTRHESFAAFEAMRRSDPAYPRLVLLTTRGAIAHVDAAFRPTDIIMVGRESAGVPESVHAAVDLCVRIPMIQGCRSLNVAVAATLVLGEAMRQLQLWPLGE